jgi:hypothetical protein
MPYGKAPYPTLLANTLQGQKADPTDTECFARRSRRGSAVCVPHLLRLRIVDSCQGFETKENSEEPCARGTFSDQVLIHQPHDLEKTL